MSAKSLNRHPDQIATETVVVCVEDEINQALTGHEGCRYESPPQPRQQALTLARALLGYTNGTLPGRDQWSCPIAGGRRTVRLRPRSRAQTACDNQPHDGGQRERSR